MHHEKPTINMTLMPMSVHKRLTVITLTIIPGLYFAFHIAVKDKKVILCSLHKCLHQNESLSLFQALDRE